MGLEDYAPKVIDIEALEKGDLTTKTEELDNVADSLSRTGFMIVGGLIGDDLGQVSNSQLTALKDAAAKYFALAEEIKLQHVHVDSGGEDRYTPFGIEAAVNPHTGELGIGDPKEFFQLRWTKSVQEGVMEIPPVPEFTAVLFDIQKKLQAKTHILYKAVAQTLGLAPDFFQRAHRLDNRGIENSVIRALHYPAENDPRVTLAYSKFRDKGEKPIRAGAHKDINLLTILLLGQSSKGLQISPKAANGKWTEVEIEKNFAAVNIGELLEIQTGGQYQATLHRVVAYERGDKSRFSFPYFNHPSLLPDQGLQLLVDTADARDFYAQAFENVYGEGSLARLTQKEMLDLGLSDTQILYKDALLNRLVDLGQFGKDHPLFCKPWRLEKPSPANYLAE